MLKITLLTCLRSDALSWQEPLAVQKECYAAAHGYIFVKHQAIWESPVIGKLDLFDRYLPETDWLVWMDADTYIANFEIKLENYISPRTSVVLGNRIYCVDPGVLMLGNDAHTRFYLNQVRSWVGQWRASCPKSCHAKCAWFMAFKIRRTSIFARFAGDWLSTHPDNPYPHFTVHPYDRPDKEAVLMGLLANQMCSKVLD